MKKLLLDECIPRRLKHYLTEHQCVTVPEAGYAGKRNGELLSLAEGAGFQVFLTLDRGLEYQQNLDARNISVVLIRARSSRLLDLVPKVTEILKALEVVQPGRLVHVS